MMSHWAQKFTRVGRDSYNLARAVVQHRGRHVKPLLLEHARNSNSVATSLLQADKEVGLVKYYGLSGYLKQRLQSTSSGTPTDSSISEGSMTNAITSSTAHSSGKSARIAFMVTVPMKLELMERLGYDAEQIKSMTPLQASLILSQSISPEEMEIKLPLAEQEYEAQRQQEEQDARLHAEKELLEQQAILSVEHQPEVPMGSAQYFGGGGYRSRNELDENHKIGIFFSASEWFQVTETNKDGETSRVGLYQDKEEAELGLKTRRDIAEAKHTNITFDIHRIDWKDLKP